MIAAFNAAKNAKSELRGDMDNIARFIAPSRLPHRWREREHDIQDREHMDTTAQIAVERFAAMVFGFMFPPHTPSVIPAIKGREIDGSDEGDWLDAVRDIMHEFLTQGSTSWRPAMSEAMLDYAAFGFSANYTAKGKDNMPRYQAMSAFNIYWRFDVDKKLMNFFWESEITLAALKLKYPDDAEVIKYAGENKSRNDDEKVTLLYAIEPNPDGKRGGPRTMKPWKSYVIWVEKSRRLEVGGYDDMPFSVATMYLRPGETYPTGLGHRVYPAARFLNRLKEAMQNGAEKSVDPPYFDFTGGQLDKLDRRAGGWNRADWAALGFSSVTQALQPLPPSGDLRPGIEIIRDERQQINTICFIDWLQSIQDGVRTATEVLDQREMRFRSMSTIVAQLESGFFDPIINRTFAIMAEAKAFPPMPDSLVGEDIIFGYRSPLSNAQDLGENDAINSALQGFSAMAQLDQNVLDLPDFDKIGRRFSKNAGLPSGLLKSDDDVQTARAARADAQAKAAQQQEAAAAAQTLQAGGQGLANLATAQQTNEGNS